MRLHIASIHNIIQVTELLRSLAFARLESSFNAKKNMGRIVQIMTAVALSFEFVLATSLLAVFASAYPDRYRSTLWHEGGSNGWNSNPSYRTYLWANYKEVPPIPLIWDKR